MIFCGGLLRSNKMYTLFYRRFFQDVILGEIVFLGPGASPDDVITRFGLQLFIGDVMHPGTQQGDMVPAFEFPTLSVNVIYFCLCREDTLWFVPPPPACIQEVKIRSDTRAWNNVWWWWYLICNKWKVELLFSLSVSSRKSQTPKQ